MILMQGANSYRAVLLSEATRFYEESQQQPCEQAEDFARHQGGSFSQRIYLRAQNLDSAQLLNARLNFILKKQRQLLLMAAISAFFIGYLSITFLLLSQNDHGVNSYLLLVALLLPNFFSLCFSLVIFSSKNLAKNFSVAAPIKNIFALWIKNKKGEDPCFKAWQTVHTQKTFASLFATYWSHNLWLLFLLGSLVGLLLRLSAHQYFFGWESTLLPQQFFISLNEALNYPLSYFGVPSLNNEQLLMSNLKSNFYTDLDLARRWAYFLMGSLLVYAIFPRAIACVIFSLKFLKYKSTMQLNTHSVAYAKLYQRLMLTPLQTNIVDIDTCPVVKKAPKHLELAFDIDNLPAHSCYLSVEISRKLPAALEACPRYLGAANDRSSQNKLLESLPAAAAKQLVILISLLGVPERGTLRYVRKIKLIKHHLIVFLIDAELAQQRLSADEFSMRLFDWCDALVDLGIEQSDICIVDINQRAAQRKLTAIV